MTTNAVLSDGDCNGTSSRWYRAAMQQRAGRIAAAGMTKDVPFEPVQGPINDRIDDAYRRSTTAAHISHTWSRQARANAHPVRKRRFNCAWKPSRCIS